MRFVAYAGPVALLCIAAFLVGLWLDGRIRRGKTGR